MTYRDMTFCRQETCANFGAKCHRSYTDEVHQRAVKWWGSEDVPVSFYTGKPECYEASDGVLMSHIVAITPKFGT